MVCPTSVQMTCTWNGENKQLVASFCKAFLQVQFCGSRSWALVGVLIGEFRVLALDSYDFLTDPKRFLSSAFFP